MGLEKDIGRLEGFMEGVEKSQKGIFKEIKESHNRIDKINIEHGLERGDIKRLLGSMHDRLDSVTQPCSYLKVTQKELECHQKEHANTVKKTGVLMVLVTVVINAGKLAWDWIKNHN